MFQFYYIFYFAQNLTFPLSVCSQSHFPYSDLDISERSVLFLESCLSEEPHFNTTYWNLQIL